jgi:hypothetical protein
MKLYFSMNREIDTNIYLKVKHLPEDETVLLKKVAHPFGYGKYCN